MNILNLIALESRLNDERTAIDIIIKVTDEDVRGMCSVLNELGRAFQKMSTVTRDI